MIKLLLFGALLIALSAVSADLRANYEVILGELMDTSMLSSDTLEVCLLLSYSHLFSPILLFSYSLILCHMSYVICSYAHMSYAPMLLCS
jgi:hypothetical protein